MTLFRYITKRTAFVFTKNYNKIDLIPYLTISEVQNNRKSLSIAVGFLFWGLYFWFTWCKGL